ncbi:uncharacterized protein E0L32_002258 [Thyridium curvatum]|uniref:DUF7896 domain-containing protein n=1 Tax=Thyridium curvatum TaxID=1093900 RepID=A0A507AEH2_9PEZI|nr:uncharacterized protein E0L32_002258 [Thyridium curvatum]TPX06762.1 hypothetical protein E0L32_002258 [Thyridium curvatum]
MQFMSTCLNTLFAGFTGILGFVGQSLNGLVKLREFFVQVKRAPKKVADLLQDIEELHATLNDVRQLAGLFSDDDIPSAGAKRPDISSLLANVRSCTEDIVEWAQVAEDLDPGSLTGLRSFFRRAKVAAEKTLFEEFGKRITNHQHKIGLSLSILGRSLDYLSHTKLDSLHFQFNGLTEAHLRLNEVVTREFENLAPDTDTKPLAEILAEAFRNQERALDDVVGELTERISVDYRSTHRSIRSIQSNISTITSSFSFHAKDPDESELSENDSVAATDNEETLEWSCDALSGIDVAFPDETCLLCSRQYKLEDAFSRGHHLVSYHNYGKCNLEVAYQDWSALRRHLKRSHKLTNQLKSNRDVLQATFLRSRVRRSNIFRHRDGAISRRQKQIEPATESEESETTSLLIHLMQANIVSEAGSIWSPTSNTPGWKAPFTPGDTNRLVEFLDALSKKAIRYETTDQTQLNLLYKAACLEEQIVVENMQSRVGFGYPSDTERRIEYLRKHRGQEAAGQDLANVWIVADPPHESPLNQYIEVPLSECVECSGFKLYRSAREAKHHITREHFGSEWTWRNLKDAENPMVVQVPGRLRHPSVTTFQDTHSLSRRIDKWLNSCFLESNATQRLLRLSPATRHLFAANHKEWFLSIMAAWDACGNLGPHEMQYARSDGAVDSRDGWSDDERLPQRSVASGPRDRSLLLLGKVSSLRANNTRGWTSTAPTVTFDDATTAVISQPLVEGKNALALLKKDGLELT